LDAHRWEISDLTSTQYCAFYIACPPIVLFLCGDNNDISYFNLQIALFCGAPVAGDHHTRQGTDSIRGVALDTCRSMGRLFCLPINPITRCRRW
jgi:hypothetical protein